jgi:methylenetetrahydrofolate dehydrogenase (NADP+)/methenyltetrahydrofolate cyclohydrolase
METKIIKGDVIQQNIFKEVKNDVDRLKEKCSKVPGIAFLGYVGHQPLMKYTIGMHVQAAKELGFHTVLETRPADTTEKELIDIIEVLNHDSTIHAIVLLQPVPRQINPIKIIERIDLNKEVEGFHPKNVMETLTKGIFQTKYPMCLPISLLELFKMEGVKVQKNDEFVFAADQDFISNPFRNMILRTASSQVIPPYCSFTLVNNDNEKLSEHCKRADYLFVISENPEFLPPDYLKPGVCIVDIYSNLVKEVPSKKDPSRLVPVIRGGVSTESVKNIAGMIAPCPGGLMPVLLAFLFRNAVRAFTDTLS